MSSTHLHSAGAAGVIKQGSVSSKPGARDQGFGSIFSDKGAFCLNLNKKKEKLAAVPKWHSRTLEVISMGKKIIHFSFWVTPFWAFMSSTVFINHVERLMSG